MDDASYPYPASDGYEDNYFDMLRRLAQRFELTPIDRPREAYFFRFAQLHADDRLFVEWCLRLSTDSADSESWQAVRAEVSEPDLYAVRAQGQPITADTLTVKTWNVGLERRDVRRIAKRFAELDVPLLTGTTRAPQYSFPRCVLAVRANYSAADSDVTLVWTNPRKGRWDHVIDEFHRTWFELEARLDSKPMSRTFRPPPRGGERDALLYAEYCTLHPLRRLPLRPR